MFGVEAGWRDGRIEAGLGFAQAAFVLVVAGRADGWCVRARRVY
jgi:hypothetical protein